MRAAILSLTLLAGLLAALPAARGYLLFHPTAPPRGRVSVSCRASSRRFAGQ